MNKIIVRQSQRLLLLGMGLLLLNGILLGCDPEASCVSLSTNEYDIGFVTTNEEGEEVAETVFFDVVRVLESDTIFFTRNETGISSLKLTLNPAADTTTFIFEEIVGEEGAGEEEMEEVIDTLQVAYRRNYRLISPECGIEINYSDLSVVYHTFEEVQALTTQLSDTTKGFDVEIFK